MNVSIVIPIYNEEGRFKNVLDQLDSFFEVILLDDCSEKPIDEYIKKEDYKNLVSVRNEKNIGYIETIKKGIAKANGDIIITMDADGEHDPKDIEQLIEPIANQKCDIVFGRRPTIARPSEVFLLALAKVLTWEKVKDSGTGFRAIRSSFAKKLEFYGSCTCGTLLLECYDKNMRICEVDVNLPSINKPRKIAWNHFVQFFYIIRLFIKNHDVKDVMD